MDKKGISSTTICRKSIKGHETIVIAVYAPIDATEDQEKDMFYNQLSDLLAKIKPHQEVILAGDVSGGLKVRKMMWL